jgi:ACS family allantoate permease-like MFS transporter
MSQGTSFLSSFPYPRYQWGETLPCRNRIPWIVIGICYLTCPVLLLTIRWLLARENARRDAEPIEEEEEFFIEKVSEDGTRVQVKVDKEFMDLTDRQNRDFRYVL